MDIWENNEAVDQLADEAMADEYERHVEIEAPMAAMRSIRKWIDARRRSMEDDLSNSLLQPQQGDWVHLAHCKHHHGFVIGPIKIGFISGAIDSLGIYLPDADPPCRLIRAPLWCCRLPNHEFTDEQFAKFAAYQLTGNP